MGILCRQKRSHVTLLWSQQSAIPKTHSASLWEQWHLALRRKSPANWSENVWRARPFRPQLRSILHSLIATRNGHGSPRKSMHLTKKLNLWDAPWQIGNIGLVRYLSHIGPASSGWTFQRIFLNSLVHEYFKKFSMFFFSCKIDILWIQHKQ